MNRQNRYKELEDRLNRLKVEPSTQTILELANILHEVVREMRSLDSSLTNTAQELSQHLNE